MALVMKHEFEWSFARALVKEFHQVLNLTQGSANAVAMAISVTRYPEHMEYSATPWILLRLRWIDDIIL